MRKSGFCSEPQKKTRISNSYLDQTKLLRGYRCNSGIAIFAYAGSLEIRLIVPLSYIGFTAVSLAEQMFYGF